MRVRFFAWSFKALGKAGKWLQMFVGLALKHTITEQPMRRLTITTLIAFSLALSACNTVRGVAADLESVANAGDEVT